MQICPESKKYIIGNIILQFLELCCNAVMIVIIITVTLLMGFGFCMMARKGIWILCIILAVVWLCHIYYFAFRVKTISKEEQEALQEEQSAAALNEAG